VPVKLAEGAFLVGRAAARRILERIFVSFFLLNLRELPSAAAPTVGRRMAALASGLVAADALDRAAPQLAGS